MSLEPSASPDLREKLCGQEPRPWDAEAGILFGAPWQAQAFSMTVALNEAGQFTWADWAAVFSRHRAASAAAGRGDDGDQYFLDWLTALEEIAAQRGLAPVPLQESYQRAWDHAAHRTQHGLPIELAPEDFTDPAGFIVGDGHHHQ